MALIDIIELAKSLVKEHPEIEEARRELRFGDMEQLTMAAIVFLDANNDTQYLQVYAENKEKATVVGLTESQAQQVATLALLELEQKDNNEN